MSSYFGGSNQKIGGNTALDLLAEKLTKTCVLIPTREVGVPLNGDDRGVPRFECLPKVLSSLLHRCMSFYDSVVGASLSERVAEAWSRTSQINPDVHIVAGSSRGVFFGQLFAQVANDWGFAHDYPLEIARAKAMIMAGERPPTGTSIGQTQIDRLYMPSIPWEAWAFNACSRRAPRPSPS